MTSTDDAGRRGGRARRRLGAVVTAAVIGMLASLTLAVVAPSPAQASTATPVLFLHGFGHDGWSCRGWFTTMRNQMRADGWTGDLDTIQYYDKDTFCNVDIRGFGQDVAPGPYDANTSLEIIGQDLAWYIYATYTSKNRYVNLVGHSMGGLIIRDAVGKSAAGWSGYPPPLLVSRVVTFSTPYAGARFDLSGLCAAVPPLQCMQMYSGSTYLTSMPSNVGSAIWLTLGSNSDPVVSCRSALAFGQRRACYDKPDYDHQNAMWDTTTSFSALLDPNAGGTYVGSYWHGVKAVEEHFR